MTEGNARQLALAHRLVDAMLPLAPGATPREFHGALAQAMIALALAFGDIGCDPHPLLADASAKLASAAAGLLRPDPKARLH